VEVQNMYEAKVTPSVAKRLRLPEGGRVFHSLIVHFENGIAPLCEDRFVNPAGAPD
jgi:GntR family histidine utilization transcriptional repressor